MDSARTNNDSDNLLRMKLSFEIHKTTIDRLSTRMNEMELNYEIEKKMMARKMTVISHQNEVVVGQLKSLEAKYSRMESQMLLLSGLQNEVNTLKAENDSFVRFKNEMADLISDLKEAKQLNDQRTTSVDSVNGQTHAEEQYRQCEEFENLSCVQTAELCSEKGPVALAVKVIETEPAVTAQDQVWSSISETKVSRPENHRTVTGLEKPSDSAGSNDVPETCSLDAYTRDTTSEADSEVQTSERTVLEVKQTTSETLIELPEKSEEARNGPEEVQEEVELHSANGQTVTEDAISPNDALRRLLSSTNPSVRKLKELDIDEIERLDLEYCLDFLEQISVEEGFQLSYSAYIPKSEQEILAGTRACVQLSISHIGLTTVGFGESLADAQEEIASNCLLFFKNSMMDMVSRPENHRTVTGLEKPSDSAGSNDVPETCSLDAYTRGTTSEADSEAQTSERTVLEVKQTTSETLIELPEKSEEARNGPGEVQEEVELHSANGQTVTEDAISPNDALRRLLSSTNPSVRKLKELDIDEITRLDLKYCLDFLEQIAVEEGVQLSFSAYVPKREQKTGNRACVQLSISHIGLTTIGFGETVADAQEEIASNCLIFFKNSMI